MKFFNFNSIIIRIIAFWHYNIIFYLLQDSVTGGTQSCSVTNYIRLVKPKKMKPKKSKMLN